MALHSAVILRPGALGDALLTLPVLHALRAAGAQPLLILGQPAAWAFLRPGLTEARVADLGAPEWLGLFAPEPPLTQRARDELAGFRTAIVYLTPDRGPAEQALRQVGIPMVLGITPPGRDDRVPEAPPLEQTQRIGLAPSSYHAAKRLLAPLAAQLGGEAVVAAWNALGLPLLSDPFLAPTAAELGSALHRLNLDRPPPAGFVAFHPGSGGRTKCWPANRFARLARAVAASGHLPLAFFGPADGEALRTFRAAAPAGVSLIAESFPLREVLALLAASRAYAGNDSGISHLAARACPTLALFGPTDPRLWRPLGLRVTVLRAKTHEMGDLSFEEVQAALVSLIRPG